MKTAATTKTRLPTKTRASLQSFDLQEITFGIGVDRVDRDNHVIKGVKLLGLESVNNNTYKDSALAAGVDLYEGTNCFFNHPARATDPRSYGDKFGKIKGVHHKPGKGLYGDIYYNPKHGLTEQTLWDAENAPESLGMSPNHKVLGRQNSQGRKIIEQITRVRSVDIVINPATTANLYEHKEETPMRTLKELLALATPHGRKFSNLLEQDGIDVTAPIDVLGDMKPVEAVADALAQTAIAIFMDPAVSPEETGMKIAELATIVEEVKAKVEPGSSAPVDEEAAVADIEAVADEEAAPEDAPAEDAPAEETPSEDAPAEDDEEEKKKKEGDATEGTIEKTLKTLATVVTRLDKRDRARGVLETAGVVVDGANLSDLMECENESAMRDVMESWSGRRRGAPRPSIRGNIIKVDGIPKDKAERKARYITK